MPWPELEAAIRAGDPDAVVAELAAWTEAERKKAVKPLAALWTELGGLPVKENGGVTPPRLAGAASGSVVESLDDVQAHLSAVGESIRQFGQWQEGIGRHDGGALLCVRLAKFACGGLTFAKADGFALLKLAPAPAVTALRDRRPEWLEAWVEYGLATPVGRGVRWPILEFPQWVALRRAGLAPATMTLSLARLAAGSLLWYGREGEPPRKLLDELPELQEVFYLLPEIELEAMPWRWEGGADQDSWQKLTRDLGAAGKLDRPRLMAVCLRGPVLGFKATHATGCFALLDALAPTPAELAREVAALLALLHQKETATVGEAVRLLAAADQGGGLDRNAAIAALPAAFRGKPKNHPLAALKLLAEWSKDDALRPAALAAAAEGLLHPQPDVQKAALTLLEGRLSGADAAALTASRNAAGVVNASVRPRLEALLATFDAPPPASIPARTPPTPSALAERVAAFAPELRSLLRLDKALAGADAGRLNPKATWPLRAGKMLVGAAPLAPIDSVDALIDAAAQALERVDAAEDAERILDGIGRLGRERPGDFAERTAALTARSALPKQLERLESLVAPSEAGIAFAELFAAWLGRPNVDDDDPHWSARRVRHAANRVRSGRFGPLWSTPTHVGGWIDPAAWLARLENLPTDAAADEDDLAASLLRLAPDRRSALIDRARKLPAACRDLVAFALGGEVPVARMEGSPAAWLAAWRCRDPQAAIPAEAPFARNLSADALRPPEFESALGIPDIAKKLEGSYGRDWFQPVRRADGIAGRLTTSSATQATYVREDVTKRLGAEHLRFFANNYWEARPLSGLAPFASFEERHFLGQPNWHVDWTAGSTPLDLEWHWARAINHLARRIDNGPSTLEPSAAYFRPLLEPDRPLTANAARALWLGVLGKDTNARSAALDAWLALVSDGRADLQMLGAALAELQAGGWVKTPRLVSALNELAAASPLHALTTAELAVGFLGELAEWPRDAAVLLEALLEWSLPLGFAPPEPLRARLAAAKSGKAKAAATGLLAIADEPGRRAEALTQLLDARLARAERFAH